MGKGLIPLGIFAVLVAFLWAGLSLNPSEVPSPLIDKPAPMFSLPLLEDPTQAMSPADLKGRVWLLNVWASWCVSCRQEHPVLVRLSETGEVPIYGLDYKDHPDDAKNWLARFGNPYTASLIDADGRVGIDYGVYGVPETYLIDKEGIIRYKHIGPVTPKVVEETLLPKVRELNS